MFRAAEEVKGKKSKEIIRGAGGFGTSNKPKEATRGTGGFGGVSKLKPKEASKGVGSFSGGVAPKKVNAAEVSRGGGSFKDITPEPNKKKKPAPGAERYGMRKMSMF